MAAPASTAAVPLQPIGRASGVGKEGRRIPDSLDPGPARHKRHDCGCSGSASGLTRPDPRTQQLGDRHAAIVTARVRVERFVVTQTIGVSLQGGPGGSLSGFGVGSWA
jgi:hypothetical protein